MSSKKQKQKLETDTVSGEHNREQASSGNGETRESTPNPSAGTSPEISASDLENPGQNDGTDAGEELDMIAHLQAENARLSDTLLRKTAEFENIRKRMMRERMQLIEEAKFDALKAFLPVNDDLQRTLQAGQDQQIPASFLQGVTMVAEKFSGVLAAYGVEPIAEEGVPFDVDLHDALMRRDAGDASVEPNTVLQVLEPGYKVGSRVIRHAKVIVSE